MKAPLHYFPLSYFHSFISPPYVHILRQKRGRIYFFKNKGRREMDQIMGRGKIEIKRIENTSNRQVTYSKRRKGLIKKAKEITVLCDAHVSLLIFSSNSNKMHDYCSPSTSLIQMLDRYHQHSGKRLWDTKHGNLSNEIDRIKKENDNMQIELRHLNGEDITSLNHKELMAIEDGLDNGLMNIREKMRESYKTMEENGQRLEEENRHLQYIYQHQIMEAMSGKMRDVGNEYNHHKMRNHYEDQMPFASSCSRINQ